MPITLPPIPYKSQVIDQSGQLTLAWSKYFLEMFNRMGGKVALSNTELETTVIANNSAIATLKADTLVISIEINDLTNHMSFIDTQVSGLGQGRQL